MSLIINNSLFFMFKRNSVNILHPDIYKKNNAVTCVKVFFFNLCKELLHYIFKS